MENKNFVKNELSTENGCKISAFYTDKFKTEILKLSITMPADKDEKGTALFALMVNLLRSGTTKYPDRSDIIRRLGDLYDSSCSIGGFASGENKILELSSEMLSDKFSDEESIFEGICELMYQMLFCPVLDENREFLADAVKREKNVILDKIKSQKNNTRSYAMKRCRELMCKGEAYGLSVKPEVLSAITTKEISEYYKNFIENSRLCFSYVGAQSIESVKNKIEKYFGNVKNCLKGDIMPLTLSETRALSYHEEELDVKQGVLVLGFKTGVLLDSADAHVMSVFNNIFGGMFNSRLYKTVREKMSLCYYCSSDYVNTKGLMFVSSGIDVNKREIAEKAILNELYKLQNEYVLDDELDTAISMTLKEFYDMLDFPGAISSFYLSRSIYGFNTTIEDVIERVKTVTKDQIRNLANKITPDTVFFLKGTAQDDGEDDYE